MAILDPMHAAVVPMYTAFVVDSGRFAAPATGKFLLKDRHNVLRLLTAFSVNAHSCLCAAVQPRPRAPPLCCSRVPYIPRVIHIA